MHALINRGFTLIEVLISLFLLSFMLLGLNTLFLSGMRQTYADYYFSIASHQLIGMIERLHALRDAEGIEEQINHWNAQNKQLLPQGVGVVSGIFPSYTVTIYWGKKPFNCDSVHFDNCLMENITV